MYYRIKITQTGCSYNPRDPDGYRIFAQFDKDFTTLPEARAYIAEQYGNCRRVKMYRDGQDNSDPKLHGGAKHIGWIYCFNADDICHVPVQKWREQDWVEIVSITERPVL